MSKWRKRIPILVMTLSVLALCVVALSFATTDEDQKEDYQQQVNAVRSTSQAELLHPDVVAKLEMEAEIQAKLEAEEEGDEEEIPLKAAYSTKDNEFGVSSIAGHPVIERDPGSVLLSEDFEAETFPPVGWDTINTDPGYGFFLGTYTGGGTQAALVTWHATGYQQDEWLLSPWINVSTASSALKLEFWFLQGYSWPHDFKIYVDVGSGMTEIWDSDTTGYPTFTWWKYTIDMSAYAGGPDIQLGFQYYGEDADLFGIDDINVNDEAPQPGRCCYGNPADPSCADVTQAECEELGGYSWNGDLNCTDNPCPVAGENDDCHDVTPDALPATWIGNNEAATYDGYCQWFGDYPNVWHAFTIEECMDITIEYCGCPAGWGNGWLNLITDCDCPDGTLLSYTSFDWGCANGNPRIYFNMLPAGTYYYPVMLDPGNGAVGDYELYVYGDPCPEPTPGDNCSDPFVVSIGGGDLPYTVASQYTCGRLDNYNATCLGSYDGGEDLIVELNLSDDMTVNITLDPKGTTWSGMGISAGCPDDGGVCIGSVTGSSGSPKTIPNLVLTAGTYYIIVDTYPTPDCIPNLDIIIEAAAGPQPGDNCANPLTIDIPSLPWCDLDQTTCGRGNYYEDPNDDICMGYYTNGEDIFYEITVSSAVTVNFHLDPKGTSYAGMGLFSSCPPTLDNCIDYETSSSSSPKSMTCVSLDPGVYYLMIDTWSTPYCIPNFDLCIVDTTCEALENDDCANATPVGEVTDLPFSTDAATFDGGGTCQSAPNIWYCYTATETGTAIITLCGSGYDTKMAVYDGCTCAPLGTELGCNDDSPCDFMRALQSTVEIPVTAGNSYLVEVGGYSSNTGEGILNIWVEEPCDVVCSGTPEGEPCINDDEEDVTNGGCNSEPPVWGTIDCDETVCGEWNTYLFGASNYRDTDWYTFTLTQFSDVTITAVGEFPIVTGFLEQVIDGGGWDCSNFTGYISPYATADECDTVVVQRLAMAPGDYAIFVGGQVFSGFGCALGTFEYSLSVDCVPAEPTYCEASGGCDEYIERVEVGTIDNTSACEGYGDFTAQSTEMAPGTGYPITITTANGYSSDTGAVYVDWNQDLDFNDPGELQSLNPGAGAGPTYSGTITPPGDALAGETRMRIRLSWLTDPVPCGTQTYGEVEDYTINVGGEAPVTYLFEPDPVYVLYKFAIDPMNGYIYLSSDAVGGDVNDMTDISLVVRENDVPITATEIIPGGHGDLPGPVMKLTFSIKEYIEGEENGDLIYDEIESFFDVYYDLDGVPGQMEGQVTMIGHTSGDLNLDGSVNVADVTYLVEWLFFGGPAPVILELADVDGSGGNPNVADLIYLVNYIFNAGPPPMHQ